MESNYKKLLPIIIVTGLSSLGAGMFSFALLLDFASYPGEVWRGGLVLSIYFLVKILASPSLGTYVDFVRNKTTVLLINQMGGLLLYIPMLFLNWHLNLHFSLIIILLTTEIILNRMSVAAILCLIKQLGETKEGIRQCIALQETCDRILGVLAPVLGAMVLANAGLRSLILVNIFSYIPAILIITIFWDELKSKTQKITQANQRYREVFKGSILGIYSNAKIIFGAREVRDAIIIIMLINATWSIFPLYMSAAFGTSTSGKYLFSVGMSCFNIGAVLVGVLATSNLIKLELGYRRIVKLYVLLSMLPLVLLFTKANVSQLFVYFFIGAMGAMLAILLSSIITFASPNDNVGGVNSTISSIGNVISPISVILYGYFVTAKSPTLVFIIMNLVFLFILLVYMGVNRFFIMKAYFTREVYNDI